MKKLNLTISQIKENNKVIYLCDAPTVAKYSMYHSYTNSDYQLSTMVDLVKEVGTSALTLVSSLVMIVATPVIIVTTALYGTTRMLLKLKKNRETILRAGSIDVYEASVKYSALKSYRKLNK